MRKTIIALIVAACAAATSAPAAQAASVTSSEMVGPSGVTMNRTVHHGRVSIRRSVHYGRHGQRCFTVSRSVRGPHGVRRMTRRTCR